MGPLFEELDRKVKRKIEEFDRRIREREKEPVSVRPTFSGIQGIVGSTGVSGTQGTTGLSMRIRCDYCSSIYYYGTRCPGCGRIKY